MRVPLISPLSQTNEQECVVQRATSIQVRVGAAATVDTFSLVAVVSPPVQRVFRAALPRENSLQGLPQRSDAGSNGLKPHLYPQFRSTL